MELEKNERINDLFEFYSPLLTQKQYDYMQLYYADDYSLGEIAEDFSVSRQAVYDNIKRTEKALEGYEQKLHLYAEFSRRNQQAERIQQYVQEHYPDDQQLNHLVTHLVILEEE